VAAEPFPTINNVALDIHAAFGTVMTKSKPLVVSLAIAKLAAPTISVAVSVLYVAKPSTAPLVTILNELVLSVSVPVAISKKLAL
jgi:hypothetical protein